MNVHTVFKMGTSCAHISPSHVKIIPITNSIHIRKIIRKYARESYGNSVVCKYKIARRNSCENINPFHA